MITRDPIQKDFNFITVSRIHYTVGTSRDHNKANKAILNFWLDDLKVQKNIYAVQPRSQFLLSRPSTVQGCIGESLFTLFASLTHAYHYLMTLIK